LTLGYSKKIDYLRASVLLLIAHFNFCRTHSAHKVKGEPDKTPAQIAGLTEHVWSISDLLKYGSSWSTSRIE
jgi:hypothetical protein